MEFRAYTIRKYTHVDWITYKYTLVQTNRNNRTHSRTHAHASRIISGVHLLVESLNSILVLEKQESALPRDYETSLTLFADTGLPPERTVCQ